MLRPKSLIMGKNCIREVLKATPGRILEVYTCQKLGHDPLYQELLDCGIKVFEVPKTKLSQLVESESHQSYVASVKVKPFIEVKAFLKKAQELDTSLVVMLDSIYDPQNLGAIIRACECFDVDLVLFSKNRGADITPVTSKTSAGATELVSIAKISNLAETMHSFQKEGYKAICADVSERSESLYDFTFPEKTLLILGSEGDGIQPLIKKKADYHVSIPMLGKIDSLNVSQAAAVLLNSYRNSLANA